MIVISNTVLICGSSKAGNVEWQKKQTVSTEGPSNGNVKKNGTNVLNKQIYLIGVRTKLTPEEIRPCTGLTLEVNTIQH